MSGSPYDELRDLGRSLDAPGPATRLDGAKAASLIDAAINRAAATPGRGWGVVPLQWAAAAAALLACSVAAGFYFANTWPAEPARSAAPRSAHTPTSDEAPAEEADALGGAATAAEPAPGPSAKRNSPRRAHRAHKKPSAARALAAANAMRAKQEWNAAYEGYRRVLGAFPNSSEAYAARVAAAELALRHLRRPRVAKQLFEQAIAANPTGSLAPAARHGLARSYRALGAKKREIETLQLLIDRHPTDPLAKLAAQRLDALQR